MSAPPTRLAFFRGGFGRFASTSRTGNDHDFRAQLAEVDLLRPEMDALAAATGCAVTINALDGDETVVVAAATQAGPRALRVRVGQRLPFAAPSRLPLRLRSDPTHCASAGSRRISPPEHP